MDSKLLLSHAIINYRKQTWMKEMTSALHAALNGGKK